MAQEPVRIKVVVDVAEAERRVEGIGSGGDRRGAVGARSEQRRRERDESERSRRPAHSRTAGAAAGAAAASGRRGAGRVTGAAFSLIRGLVSASALRAVAEVLPGILSEKLKTGDPTFRLLVQGIESLIGSPLEALGDKLREMDASITRIGAFLGAATTAGTAAQLAGTLQTGEADPLAVARISAQTASARRALELERQRVSREALGAGLVHLIDGAIGGTAK